MDLRGILDEAISFFARGLLVLDMDLEISYGFGAVKNIEPGVSLGEFAPELEARMHSHMVALLKGEQQFFSAYIPLIKKQVFIHGVRRGDIFILLIDEMADSASSKRLQEAIDQASETVLITDIRGVIVYANPAFQQITGYSLEEAIGRTPAIVKSGHHDEEYYSQMWNHILAGKVWKGSFINKKKDGTLYEEEASIAPVFDEKGVIRNFVAVKKDVTQERELERRLIANHRLKSLGTFAGGIAHDFNNILISILGYADLILKKYPKEEYANEIIIAAERGQSLVSQITSFSRQKKGTPQIADLKYLITEVMSLMKPAIPRSVILETNLQEDLYLCIQNVHIHQIVMNLMVNSIQAIEGPGHIEISLKRSADDDVALLCVEDSGCGMSSEVLTHVFDPFFTTKEVAEGAGMGLSVVYGIVKEYGGDISVDSVVGTGTKVTVELPLHSGGGCA